MPISSVSQASAQILPAIAAPAKGAAAPAATTATTTPSPATATTQAAPDKDEAAKTSSASAPNMYKLNPDGTVGPLHLHRAGHSTHA